MAAATATATPPAHVRSCLMSSWLLGPFNRHSALGSFRDTGGFTTACLVARRNSKSIS
jgi:hypothetical protein